MSDDTRTTDDGATQDDASGHVLHGDAAQNPTTGGGHAPSVQSFRAVGPDDEPEGDTDGPSLLRRM